MATGSLDSPATGSVRTTLARRAGEGTRLPMLPISPNDKPVPFVARLLLARRASVKSGLVACPPFSRGSWSLRGVRPRPDDRKINSKLRWRVDLDRFWESAYSPDPILKVRLTDPLGFPFPNCVPSNSQSERSHHAALCPSAASHGAAASDGLCFADVLGAVVARTAGFQVAGARHGQRSGTTRRDARRPDSQSKAG